MHIRNLKINKRNLLAIMIAGVLTFSFANCSADRNNSSDNSSDTGVERIYDEEDSIDTGVKRVYDDEETSIGTVVAPGGAWLRGEPVIDRNDNDAILIETGTEIIVSNELYSSKDNTYLWRKVSVKDGDKAKTGYMATNLISVEGENDKSSYLVTLENDDVTLKLRKDPLINGDIITEIPNGSTVEIIQKRVAKNNNIEWAYISYKDSNGNIQYGYSAMNRIDTDGNLIEYLVDENKQDASNYTDEDTEELVESIDSECITKIVDVSSTEVDFLRLCEKPGVNSKEILRIPNGSKVHITENDFNNPIKKDDILWVKVKLVTGEEGYVSSMYLVDEKELEEKEKAEGTDYNFGDEGIINGKFGIDFAEWSEPSYVKAILNKDNEYTDSFPNMHETRPSFAIMRITGTGYGTNFKFIGAGINELNQMIQLLNVLEESEIPFGVYYYSQATTMEEAEIEAENIAAFVKLLDIKSRSYFKFPIYLDFEEKANGDITRIYTNAQTNGKSNQTAVSNHVMNKTRELTGLDVCMYTDNNTLNSTIEFSEFDDINKKDSWIVDVSRDHSNPLLNNHREAINNASVRQTDIDVWHTIDDGSGFLLDYNIMDSDYYNQKVKNR